MRFIPNSSTVVLRLTTLFHSIARKWCGSIAHAILAVLPPFNFLTVHYVYFIGTCLVTSVIFYLTSTPWRSVSYVDSLFMCVSAMTGAGLNVVCDFLPSFLHVFVYTLIRY